MGQLYRLDFESGKSYIGISSKSAEVRFRSHLRAVNGGSSTLLCRAWRKYGDPVLTVIAEVEDSHLFEAEKRAIVEFGTKTPNGYNTTDGGEGVIGYEHTAEARANIGRAQKGNTNASGGKGKVLPAEVRRKISESLKGRIYTDQIRSNMSKAQKGRVVPKEVKANMVKAQAAIHPPVEKVCEVCGKIFRVPPNRKDTAKACSNECGKIVRAKSIDRNNFNECKRCGKSFHVPASHKDRRLYCSKECSYNKHTPIAKSE